MSGHTSPHCWHRELSQPKKGVVVLYCCQHVDETREISVPPVKR